MIHTITIEKPFSANKMYVPIDKGRLIKSKAYREWIEHNSQKINKVNILNFPVDIDILIIGGRDFNTESDIDNLTKPIIDLLVKTGILPNDNTKYVERAEARYLFGSKKSPAYIQVNIKENE